MAFTKKPGIAVEIGVGKAPRPPLGMKDAPMPPDDAPDSPDDEETEESDVTARLTKMEALLNKIAEAVGVEQDDEQPEDPNAAPEMAGQ